MPVISEKMWRTALTKVLEDLDEQQYSKMLFFLSEIPKYVKTKSREEMPQAIIEHYGVETSVSKINEIMDQIPRRDPAVQDRLRPFVDKLKNKQEEKTGKKRKRKSAGRKDEAGEQKNHQPDETEPAGPEKPKKKRTQSRIPSLNSTRANKTPKVSEKKWKKALTNILGKLNNLQYDKMLTSLKMPKQKKTAKFKLQMPQKIIERHGLEASIRKIKVVLDRLPRRDEAVQKHLRPLVDKLKNKQGNKTGKRKSCQPNETEAAGTSKPKKKKPENRDSSLQSTPRAESVSRLQDADPSEPAVPKLQVNTDSSLKLNGTTKTPTVPAKERRSQPWRKYIHDLKITGNHGNKAIAGKVVQKSGLRTYRTRNEEEKFFFYLGVADDTSSIRVMVYGPECYQFFSEGSCYLFRDVIMEGELMKVTKKSNISKAPPLDVPENLEMEARMLVDFQIPVRSIAQANIAEEKTSVSVEGTITEIGPVKNIELKAKRGKKDKQEFRLEDGTGSIRITLWGEDTKHLRGISRGDVARVTNVKTSHYRNSVSLNSTDSTRILKVQSATVQNVTIEIIGIIKASRMQTELEAEISQNNEVQRFVVDSSLLAEAFGVRLEGDLEDSLLSKMPFSADVDIEGNQITKIKSTRGQ